MTPDYPAAHSMDTTWFAVDADGHVARFDSGEDGAVPNVAGTEAGAADASFDTFFLDVVRIARIVAEDPGDEAKDPLPDYTPQSPNRAVVIAREVFSDAPAPSYRDPARVRSEVEALLPGELLVLRERDPRIVASTLPLDAPTLAKVREHPAVVRVVLEEEFFECFEEAHGIDGLFAFGREHGAEAGSGAYFRQKELPTKAITIDDVPEVVRAQVAGVRLPIRFAEVETVNLADHMTDADVSTWGEMPLRPLPPEEQAIVNAERATSVKRTKVIVIVVALAIVGAILLGRQ